MAMVRFGVSVQQQQQRKWNWDVVVVYNWIWCIYKNEYGAAVESVCVFVSVWRV